MKKIINSALSAVSSKINAKAPIVGGIRNTIGGCGKTACDDNTSICCGPDDRSSSCKGATCGN